MRLPGRRLLCCCSGSLGCLCVEWRLTLTGSTPRGLSDLVVVGLGAPSHESLLAGLPSDAVFRWANGEISTFAAFSRFAQHLLRCLRCLYG